MVPFSLHPYWHLLFINFDDSNSDRCEVKSHFDSHFSNNYQCWESFHMPISHLYIFGKMSIQVLCTFFFWLGCFFFFDIEFYEIFICFGYWLFWGLFRAAPAAYGGSLARVLIRADSLHHSHSNARSKPCLQPSPQLRARPDS